MSPETLIANCLLSPLEEGNGVTFVGGIKSHFTLNLLLSEDLGYYDADGNLVEIADDVTKIIDKGDITVKKLTN